MTSERWQRIETLYHAALARPAGERPAYLHEACAGDEGLRLEVESLLAQSASDPNFLGTPAAVIAARTVLHVGESVGPYQIVGALGAGGMGEVYRARDRKLNRDVALKVLPAAFAVQVDRLARFKREAHVLASLNHPHIAAIYGFEDSGSTHALVLELVDGPTLADRIARGPLHLDEALAIAKQVAAALEAAHEQRVVHRDLKPANIKVRDDGTVKVLDFGLAKALDVTAAGDFSQSPTLAVHRTSTGLVLGTIAYMAPEQARGKPVDKRADLWSFGCVLFEMLTGRPAFAGDTASDIVAAVMKNEPDWEGLPADVPETIRALLRRLLQKDPAQRQRDAGDVVLELNAALAPPARVRSREDRRRDTRWVQTVAWATVVLALLFAGSLYQWAGRRAESGSRPVTRLELNLPAGVEIDNGYSPKVAVSPDGAQLVFVGMADDGVRQLYLRRFDEFAASVLRGTDTVWSCVFSPDGSTVAFIVGDRTLKKISLANRLVSTLAHSVDWERGLTWGEDDRITFARDGTLWQIAASGGVATQISRLDASRHELAHSWPSSVAGGRWILFNSLVGSRRDDARIEALGVATGERRVVLESGEQPFYLPTGHLLFYREGALMAVPFDLDRLSTRGTPVRMVEDIGVDFVGAHVLAHSNTGSLIYPSTGTQASRLVWVSRQGVEQEIMDSPQSLLIPRLAPDGRRIVVQAGGDLWIEDTTRTTFTRLTSDATSGNSFPVWTPDGSRVVFRTMTGMHVMDADGSGHTQPVSGASRSVIDLPTTISPDGGKLAFIRQGVETSGDIYWLSLRGDDTPHPIVKSAGYDGGAQFSPDGRWMAYTSNESGRTQVFVRPFPGPDRSWPVSTHGGTHPQWNPNGRELFYRDGKKMMAVNFSATGSTLSLSDPHLLFEQRYAFGSAQTVANFDVTKDGQRFLMVKNDSAGARLNVVLNWFEELKQRVPSK
jgi:Tol biopolymer transport system component